MSQLVAVCLLLALAAGDLKVPMTRREVEDLAAQLGDFAVSQEDLENLAGELGLESVDQIYDDRLFTYADDDETPQQGPQLVSFGFTPSAISLPDVSVITFSCLCYNNNNINNNNINNNNINNNIDDKSSRELLTVGSIRPELK